MTPHHCFQPSPFFWMGFAKYHCSGFQNLPPKSVDKQNDRFKNVHISQNQTIWTSKIVHEKKSQLRVKNRAHFLKLFLQSSSVQHLMLYFETYKGIEFWTGSVLFDFKCISFSWKFMQAGTSWWSFILW